MPMKNNDYPQSGNMGRNDYNSNAYGYSDGGSMK